MRMKKPYQGVLRRFIVLLFSRNVRFKCYQQLLLGGEVLFTTENVKFGY